VVLAADAIDKLVASGQVVAGSRVDLVRSGVAVAVKAGAPRPDIDTEDAVRAAVLAAPSIGYSTGPSGTRCCSCSSAGASPTRCKRAPEAGAARRAGRLHGRQRRRGAGLPAVRRTEGPGRHRRGRPAAARHPDHHHFLGRHRRRSSQPQAVRDLLAWMAAPATADTKRRNGMDPA
jgi:molybdate transport system substrate-binding protein